MSIFYNNYKRLVQENNDAVSAISGESFKILKGMFDYLETYNVSLFELEVLKKDLIGLAKEADMEGIAFLDKIGMPEKIFCDSLVMDGIKPKRLERFIPWVRDIIISDFFFYALLWFFEGAPETFGFPTWLLILDMEFFVLEYVVWLRLQRKKAERVMEKTKKKGEAFYSSLMFLATFTFFMCDWEPGYLPEFIIYGSGSIIFFVLLALSIAVFFGNNYYWDKCSEKYNWR